MQIKQPEDFMSRNRTIKHNHLYVVDDFQGNIPANNTSGMGLYHLDTRFLSCFEIKLHGTDPIPLLSSSDLGYMSTIVFTNGPIETVNGEGKPVSLLPEMIQLKRETVLYGLLFERYWLVSYHPEPIEIEISFRFDADFRDMFDIRGIVNIEPPQCRPPIMDNSGSNPVLIFGYRDQSGRHLQTGIRFVDAAPDFVEDAEIPTVVYKMTLQPREPFTFNYELQTVINDKMMNAGNLEATVSSMDEALNHLNFRTRLIHRDTTIFTSDNQDFNEMMTRNHKDMNMLMTHTEEGGYIAAGIPWYVALFGRDSLITSRFALMFDAGIARESLKILAKYQGTAIDEKRNEEPGKILHELRVGELARLRQIPHTPYYGSVDATPLFIMTLYDYFIWTNDRETLDLLWPNALRALSWIDENLKKHPQGYCTYRHMPENGILQQGWKDSHDSIMNAQGIIGEPPIALSEVQGYVYQAKLSLSKLADLRGDHDLAETLLEECRIFKAAFNRDFWVPDLGFCAIALDQQGNRFDVVSSNPGHCLESGILNPENADKVMQRLMASDMFNGWGIRTLSSDMAAYNPMSYHNGSIWPHDNAMIVRGFAALNRQALITPVFIGLFDAARHTHYRRLPELFCGFRKEEGKDGDPPVRYPVACSPQAWASATMYSLIQSMLNLVPDAVNKRLYIKSPTLPPFLNYLQIANLRVGDAIVDLDFRRTNQIVTVDVHNRQGDLDILISL